MKETEDSKRLASRTARAHHSASGARGAAASALAFAAVQLLSSCTDDGDANGNPVKGVESRAGLHSIADSPSDSRRSSETARELYAESLVDDGAITSLMRCRSADELPQLIADGNDLEAADAMGRTALVHAAVDPDRSLSVVRALIDLGASAEVRIGRNRWSIIPYVLTALPVEIPLDSSEESRRAELVSLLVEAGAPLHECDIIGRSALNMIMPVIQSPAAVRVLLEKSDMVQFDEGDRAFLLAWAAGMNPEAGVTKALLEFGLDPNSRAEKRRSVLVKACGFATEEVGVRAIELLVNAGADIAARSEEGESPLFAAARNAQQVGIVEYLVTLGADPNALTNEGQSPLMAAAGFGGSAVSVATLLRAGANTSQVDRLGRTALHHAATFGTDPSIIVALLEAGCEINARADGSSGVTALGNAVENHKQAQLEIVRALIDGGADVNAPGWGGYPLLVGACRFCRLPSVIELLLDSGAEPNADALEAARKNKALFESKVYWRLSDAVLATNK